MDKSVIIWGVDMLAPHPTHSICKLHDQDHTDPLGTLDHPIYAVFPYLKEIRAELKTFRQLL